jgi:hypothetical protein
MSAPVPVIIPQGGLLINIVAFQGPNSHVRITVTNHGPDVAELSIAGPLAVGNSRVYTLSQVELDCKSIKGCTLLVQFA